MVAFGTCAYLWLFAPDALRRALAFDLRGVLLAAGLVVLFSAILWLALESASMAGDWSGTWDPDMLEGVLFDTAFGRLWQARLALCAVLAAALALRVLPAQIRAARIARGSLVGDDALLPLRAFFRTPRRPVGNDECGADHRR